CTNHIFLAGNEEQKKKYVSKLATGEYIGAWGLTEPSSGSDAGSARMHAVRRKDGWVLNGTKTFCTIGHYADVLVVIAVTDRAAPDSSKQREQFGKAIREFQAIQWKVADMATEIDAARLLTMRAASMKDTGMKSTLESSMAKLYASEVAVRCANEGVQIHGGYG